MVFLDWRNEEEVYAQVIDLDDLDKCIEWLKRKREKARQNGKNFFVHLQIGKEIR